MLVGTYTIVKMAQLKSFPAKSVLFKSLVQIVYAI